MIYHVAFFKLKPETEPERLESIQRQTRSQLLKIPETLAVRAGRNLDPDSPYQFFYSIECESRLKLQMLQNDAFYTHFISSVVEPNTLEKIENTYELEPGKDLKYS